MRGKFITIEGGEGTGKSTQLSLLADYLKAKNLDVVITKEPGGTEVGLEIRKILLTGDKDKMDPIAEALMYYADRRIHLASKILPALDEGKWVISDRFADSTMAYQYYGYNKRVSKEVLAQLHEMVVGNAVGGGDVAARGQDAVVDSDVHEGAQAVVSKGIEAHDIR